MAVIGVEAASLGPPAACAVVIGLAPFACDSSVEPLLLRPDLAPLDKAVLDDAPLVPGTLPFVKFSPAFLPALSALGNSVAPSSKPF